MHFLVAGIPVYPYESPHQAFGVRNDPLMHTDKGIEETLKIWKEFEKGEVGNKKRTRRGGDEISGRGVGDRGPRKVAAGRTNVLRNFLCYMI